MAAFGIGTPPIATALVLEDLPGGRFYRATSPDNTKVINFLKFNGSYYRLGAHTETGGNGYFYAGAKTIGLFRWSSFAAFVDAIYGWTLSPLQELDISVRGGVTNESSSGMLHYVEDSGV